MNRVYIIYQKNGFGGSEVAEVFASRVVARKYVIDKIFGTNEFYRDKKEDVLNSYADKHIHKYEVFSKL